VKNLILIVGKLAIQEKDCPINDTLLKNIIGNIANDKSMIGNIIARFTESKSKIESMRQRTLESLLQDKDRTIFRHIDILPPNLLNIAGQYIHWFSDLLTSKLAEDKLQYVFKYLIAINRELP
jgi:hypothetical protein